MTAPPAPAAPWRSVIDAVLWWHAAAPAARRMLPAPLAGDVGRPGRATAAGEDWALAVTTTARRRALPCAGGLRCVQVWPDGRPRAFAVRVRGRMRLGHAEVEHTAASPLADWLVTGRHPAILLSGIQDVLAPRP